MNVKTGLHFVLSPVLMESKFNTILDEYLH